VVTRNGIDAARFDGPLPKKENILAFTSSPNRGLLTLLAYMPIIRKQVPDAVVHGCYGIDTWLQFATARLHGAQTDEQRGQAQAELAEIQRYQGAIAAAEKAGFLVWHGKVNQQKVADIFKSAKVHGYAASTPQPFPETYCISALEAQAAGAVVIGTKWAGLPETVKHGFLVEPGPQYGQAWVDHCIHMLTDEATRSAIAEKARPWALTQTWAALAADWSQMFTRAIEELRTQPVAIWRAA
jgi:glycosyltransferase involved in cell wall biosynthesis